MGLGSRDAAVNPFLTANTPFLSSLLGGEKLHRDVLPAGGEVVFRRLDATLGHPGLPQSATGQTTLLTGINGADVMNGHYGPWPGPTLKVFLERGTLFSEAASVGEAQLANAYPPGYFTAIGSGRARMNVPVFAAREAGLELPDLDAYGRGEAVAADLTGEYFAAVNGELQALTPEQSGAVLARLASERAFTFFDFWLSDRIGHRGSFAEAVAVIETLDRFLSGVAREQGDVTVLVTSDHGNLEDKTTRGHTRAPVPLLATGPSRRAFASCESLLDVAPAVRSVLGLAEPP